MGYVNTSDESLRNANARIMRQHAILFFYMAVVLILGAVGNTLSFIYHRFVQKRRTVTSFLISTLALNDLLASLVLLDTMLLLRYIMTFESDFVCKLTFVLNHTLVVNSILFLNVIGLERCSRVCAENQRYRITKRRVTVLMACLFSYSFLVACRHLHLGGVGELHVTFLDGTSVVGRTCHLLKDSPTAILLISIFHWIDVGAFVIANISFCIAYGMIAKRLYQLRKSVDPSVRMRRHAPSSRIRVISHSNYDGSTVTKNINYRERKISVMLGTLTLSSMLSFIPYFCVEVFVKPRLTESDFIQDTFLQLSWRSFMLNSSLNPYVIGLFSSKFRNFVRSLFPCKIIA